MLDPIDDRPAADDPSTRIAIEGLAAGGSRLLGRDPELAALDAAWRDPAVRVVFAVGEPGVGRTTLVRHWLERRIAASGPRAFGWTFAPRGAGTARTISADLFALALDDWLDRFDAPGQRRGARPSRLRRAPTALVLDGLDPWGPAWAGPPDRIEDRTLAALLAALAKGLDGLCVVTTARVPEGFTAETPGVGVVRVGPLADAAVERLVGHWTTDRASIRAIVRAAGGHALCATALAAAIARGEPAPTEAMDAVTAIRALDRRLPADARCILRVSGLFDRVDPAALEAVLAAPAIPGLTDGLTDGPARRRAAIETARDVGLLPTAGADLSPTVRRVFAAALQADDPAAWMAAHGRIFDHLVAHAPEKAKCLADLEPLYRALRHGCAAGRARPAQHDVYFRRIQRGNAGHSSFRLGSYAVDLAGLSHLFDAVWDRPRAELEPRIRGWLLHEAGYAMVALGRLDAARPALADALTMAEARFEAARAAADALPWDADWEAEWDAWELMLDALQSCATSAHVLADCTLALGHVDAAIGHARAAVDWADRGVAVVEDMGRLGQMWDWLGELDDDLQFTRLVCRTGLADALDVSGQRAEARAAYVEAEQLQAERQPRWPRLYSLQGCDYGVFSLPDDPADALDRAEWMLRLVREQRGRPGELAAAHLLRARALLALDPTAPGARPSIRRALSTIRRLGRPDRLAAALVVSAMAHRLAGKLSAAGKCLDEARMHAERAGLRLVAIDLELEAARVALDRGDRPAAEHHHRVAHAGVEAHGYHRCADALHAIEQALTAPG